MYYLTACLLFLIITPRVSFIRHGRKILFVLILIVQSYFYLAYEEIDPLVYALHLTPVCVAMVALFEGGYQGRRPRRHSYGAMSSLRATTGFRPP